MKRILFPMLALGLLAGCGTPENSIVSSTPDGVTIKAAATTDRRKEAFAAAATQCGQTNKKAVRTAFQATDGGDAYVHTFACR